MSDLIEVKYTPVEDLRPSWLKELIPPSFKERGEPTEILCPSCKTKMTFGMIPCPDGREGCIVCHYGYRCPECLKIWYVKMR
ncbi:MAG: hypothetical protein M0R32_11040 [Candidatus Cloacimonetes bacterium]|jgi:hypothetical protein|nr:hypothetical protein [Candidatus Cloacimonadota bacterium]